MLNEGRALENTIFVKSKLIYTHCEHMAVSDSPFHCWDRPWDHAVPSSDEKLLFPGRPLDQITVESLYYDLNVNTFHETSILR